MSSRYPTFRTVPKCLVRSWVCQICLVRLHFASAAPVLHIALGCRSCLSLYCIWGCDVCSAGMFLCLLTYVWMILNVRYLFSLQLVVRCVCVCAPAKPAAFGQFVCVSVQWCAMMCNVAYRDIMFRNECMHAMQFLGLSFHLYMYDCVHVCGCRV